MIAEWLAFALDFATFLVVGCTNCANTAVQLSSSVFKCKELVVQFDVKELFNVSQKSVFFGVAWEMFSERSKSIRVVVF